MPFPVTEKMRLERRARAEARQAEHNKLSTDQKIVKAYKYQTEGSSLFSDQEILTLVRNQPREGLSRELRKLLALGHKPVKESEEPVTLTTRLSPEEKRARKIQTLKAKQQVK